MNENKNQVKETQNRYTSPVVIYGTLVVLGAQITALSQNPKINGWAIAAVIVTVATAYYQAVNDPTNKYGF